VNEGVLQGRGVDEERQKSEPCGNQYLGLLRFGLRRSGHHTDLRKSGNRFNSIAPHAPSSGGRDSIIGFPRLGGLRLRTGRGAEWGKPPNEPVGAIENQGSTDTGQAQYGKHQWLPPSIGPRAREQVTCWDCSAKRHSVDAHYLTAVMFTRAQLQH